MADLYATSINQGDPLFSNGRGRIAEHYSAVAKAVATLEGISLSSLSSHTTGTAYEELIRNTFEKSENQQFFTPRNIVSFMVSMLDIPSGASVCDPACGSGGFLSETTNISDSKRLYGFEIDKRMAWVTKMNLAIHGAEQGKVVHLPGTGSLGDPNEFPIPPGGFDFIVTNPPFGSDFQDGNALATYELGRGRSSRRRGALFVERCIQLLKKGTGRLAIVLDEGILNGSSNSDVRALMLRECVVEAVIGLPEVAFKPYASVKTSIVVLRRRKNAKDFSALPIFMADVERIGRKPNGDPSFKRGIDGDRQLDDDLPNVLKFWNQHNSGKQVSSSDELTVFQCDHSSFERQTLHDNRLDVLFHHPARARSEMALQAAIYPIRKLGELVYVRNQSLMPCLVDPSEIWRYVGLANISSRTGEYDVSEAPGDQLKSAVKRFEPGDVVYSKLRPELRKCFVAKAGEDEAYASAECIILANRSDQNDLLMDGEIDPNFLAIYLRSDLAYGQLVFQVTGTGRPRVAVSALLNVRIPLPPIDMQREFVAAHHLAEAQYREHRRRSDEELLRGSAVLRRIECYAESRLCNLSP